MAESPQGNPGAEQARLPDLFLKAVKAAIIGTDLSGIVNFWNPFAEELYGWSPEEVMGRNIMEITVSTETEEEARKYMASVLAGNSWAGEFQVRCKDAGFVSAFVTLALVKDDNGAAVGVVGVSQDTAELRRRKERCGGVKNSFERLPIRCPSCAGWRTAMAGFSGVTRGGTSTRERSRSKWRERARGRCTMQRCCR